MPGKGQATPDHTRLACLQGLPLEAVGAVRHQPDLQVQRRGGALQGGGPGRRAVLCTQRA